MKNKIYTYKDHLKESLDDPEFEKIWNKPELKYILAEQIIKKRTEKRLSQRALAKKLKTSQAAVSRIETMSGNPTLSFIEKVAHALDTKITLRFG